MTDDETAPCAQCRSEISTEASVCPQCGHAPGTSLLFTITLGTVALIAVFAALNVIFLPISFVVPAFPDVTLAHAIGWVVTATITIALTRHLWRKRQRRPVDG
jgi:hypothetical protein